MFHEGRTFPWTLVCFLLSLFYFITASFSKCESSSEKCYCHSTYNKYNKKLDNRQNVTNNCLKVFNDKLDWDSAHRTCEKEYSYILQKQVVNSSFFQEIEDQGIGLIWTGIRRVAGFYVYLGSNEPGLFKESNREWGRKWNVDEPMYDCVALNVHSGLLITHPCSNELRFVCQNNGFPIYPVEGTLACSENWLYFYQLPMSRKKCLQAFKSNSLAEANKRCSRAGGEIADLEDYFALHSYMSELNITVPGRSISSTPQPFYFYIGVRPNLENNTGSNPARNDTESYVTEILLSVLGTAVRNYLNFNCTDKIFICEKDSRSVYLNTRIIPHTSEAFPSNDSTKNLLTCEVLLNGKNLNLNGMKKQLLYQWFKNGIPISVNSHLFQLGFYSDPTKSYPFSVNRQGTYKCGTRIAGLSGMQLSPEINYFYSDVSTYILTLQGDAQILKYRDFSQLDFRKFKANLKLYMAQFTKDLKTDFPHLKWDFQSFSLDGNVSTIKFLLYIKRNESLYVQLQNETEVYQLLTKYIVDFKAVSSWTLKPHSLGSLSLQSAGVCFRETVPSSVTSHEGILLWKDTLQTKTAISEPMCLNGWKLVTRECNPSITDGARWQSFNYSLCSKYQPTVKDLIVECPEGFRKLKSNLCYSVNLEGYTFNEADEICLNSSSYLITTRVLNMHSTQLFAELDTSISYWISRMNSYHALNPQTLLAGERPKDFNFHCASVTWFREMHYNFSFENCKKELAFICIHQPLNLVSSIMSSRYWTRLSTQKVCYHTDFNKRSWAEANDTCHSLSVKSSLLQSIQSLKDYSLFKLFLDTAVPPFGTAYLWWMDLVQLMDTLQWSNSQNQSLEYVDWNAHTDFSMHKSAGAITFDDNRFQWILKDSNSKEEFICEIQDCTDTRPVFAYIEDRTVRGETQIEDYAEVVANFSLRCVPSGWFISDSISWYKDDALLPFLQSSDHLALSVNSPASLTSILPFQGYYSCSIDQDKPFRKISSSKVLFRVPGLHTFVLYMHLPDRFVDDFYCSDIMEAEFSLPLDLTGYFNETLIYGFESAVLEKFSCNRSEIHYYSHIYVRGNYEDEARIMKNVEGAVIKVAESSDEFVNVLKIKNRNILSLSLRSTVACHKENTSFDGHTTTWPSTPVGHSALSEEICITDKGEALERKCQGDFNTGAFWGQVRESCVDTSSMITLNLHKLSKTNITEDNILKSSLNMESIIASSEDLNLVDVQYVAQILRNMATVPSIKPEVLSSVINTVDHVIGVKHLMLDNRESSSNVSSKISAAMENIVTNLNTNEHTFKEAGDNIAISVFRTNNNVTLIPTGGFLENWSSNLTTLFNGTVNQLHSRYDVFEAGILFPENLVAQNSAENVDDMSIIIHKNFHYVENIRVVSPVIDVSLGNMPLYDVFPPIEMIFKVPKVNLTEKMSSFECAFWDQNLNDNFGGWSYKGCFSSFLDDSHVHCSCDHLTSFAVILELKPGSKLLEVHQTALSIITYIGCSLSIFGLGVIILTFILFRKWRKDLKHKALFNLSLALVSFLLIFLIGIEKRGPKYGCIIIAIFLHYFMLASFAWMLVEAFMQYLSLVKVIGTYIPRFMQKAVIFAWGVPLVIVVIIVSINFDLYNSKHKYCWLSDKAFYYAVAGPVLAMLAMNFVIFALILYSNTCGRSKKYLRTNQNERQETITRAKAVFCVSVLLGLSWIFGFLAVDGAKLVFQYLFAVTTTLQGFFIFIFFVCRQKNTRDLWLSLITPTTTPEISHITGGTDVGSRGGINQNGQRTDKNRLSRAVFKARLSYVSFNG